MSDWLHCALQLLSTPRPQEVSQKFVCYNFKNEKKTLRTGCWFVGGDGLTGALHDL